MIVFLIYDLKIKGGSHKQFLKMLEYTDEQNIDFKVITSHLDLKNTYPGFEKFKNKITVVQRKKGRYLVSKVLNHFIYFDALKNAISKGDIINIHDGGFEKYLGAFRGKKVFWQVNDLHQCFNEGVSNSVKKSFLNKILKIYVKSNISIITKFTVNVSKNAERIKKHFNRDAHVFYCGIESLGFVKENTNSFQRFAANKINLLSSGVFFPYRNYETQIKVVKRLRKEGLDVSLNIFGSTMMDIEYSNKIKKIIFDENLSDYIKVLGQIDYDHFLELHKNSDLFLFVNIDQSWGLAVFEAMSCGLPVILSESVGATEILHNGIDSVFVQPTNDLQIANEIIKMMSDEKYYLEISTISSNFHENYSWNKSYCSKMLNMMIEI
jgi:glycosyltransferase involved in cell wall biosynthesis